MTILLISILMQTGQPKLELPKIVVYGQRNVRLEIWKEDLIPDTVSKLTFPKPMAHNFEASKFSYPWSYSRRNVLLTGTGALGNDFFHGPVAFLKLLYARSAFYTIASYSYNRRTVKHEAEINARVPYVRTALAFKKYKHNNSLGIKNRNYTRVSLTSNINRDPFFFESTLLLGNLQKDEPQELAFLLKSTLLKTVSQYPTTSTIYLSWNKVWLLCLTERVTKNWRNLNLELGIDVACPKLYISPYISLKGPTFYLQYYSRTILRTRDESLEFNPFIKDVLSRDYREGLRNYRKYFTFGITFEPLDIEGGWIQNYPSFQMDTISDTTYTYNFDNTDITWISPSIHWKGIKATANYSYRHKPAPHIPVAYVSVEYPWGNLTVTPCYKYVKDYQGKTRHLLYLHVSWLSPYHFMYSISRSSFFIEVENLPGGYEVWKGYHEKPKFRVGTKFKL